jgi:hypothetical protein
MPDDEMSSFGSRVPGIFSALKTSLGLDSKA